MVLVGIDPDNDTHTVVAVDQAGRQLDQRTVPARAWPLVSWARTRWPERTWAVEDCRHVTGRLERDLLAAGARVVGVPARLLAGARQAVGALGKSDPIDALAVARAARREPNLPTAGHDQTSWEVKLLVDHREHLVAERTRQIHRLRWQLQQLDPTWNTPPAGCPVLAWSHHRLARPGHPGVQVGICRTRSPRAAHSPTRSASWIVNSASGSPDWPDAAQPARLRAADRGQADRRDRRGGPVPL